MIRNRLRIYCGPEQEAQSTVVAAAKDSPSTVTVPASEVFSILADAIESNRTWLRDFENDEVTVSTDLYEILLAYRHMRRPSA